MYTKRIKSKFDSVRVDKIRLGLFGVIPEKLRTKNVESHYLRAGAKKTLYNFSDSSEVK